MRCARCGKPLVLTVLSVVLLVCLDATSADAQTDLLWQHSDGRLAVWKMQRWVNLSGDPLGLGQLPDPSWQLVASSDFNSDGFPDHIFQHQADGRLAIWLMNRHAMVGGFPLSPDRVSDLSWKVRGAGDFDGDSRPDLIWQNEVTGQVSVWLMDGTTRRDGQLLSPPVVADTDWRIVGVADFNQDGHSDLLWQHQNNGLIAVWYMNGLNMVDGVLVSNEVSDPNLKIRAVGDVDGDAQPDLVWQNQATGLLATWVMAGHVRQFSALLSPDRVADTGWRIVGMHYSQDFLPCIPKLVSPSRGALLDNGRTDRKDAIVWAFDWTECPGATAYSLIVYLPRATFPVVNTATTQSSFESVRCGSFIAPVNASGWRVRLRAFVDGVWGPWSPEYNFDVEPPNTDPTSSCAEGLSSR